MTNELEKLDSAFQDAKDQFLKSAEKANRELKKQRDRLRRDISRTIACGFFPTE